MNCIYQKYQTVTAGPERSTEEVLNHDPPEFTRSDIFGLKFGADDTSDEDVVHTAETGGKKRKTQRVRLSEMEKNIEIALYYQKNLEKVHKF